jgi:hypothetical protein
LRHDGVALVLGEPAPQPASDDFFGGGEPAVRALLCPEALCALIRRMVVYRIVSRD